MVLLFKCRVFGSPLYFSMNVVCRYVRLNALDVLHVHGPRFNAPQKQSQKNVQFANYVELKSLYDTQLFGTYSKAFHIK